MIVSYSSQYISPGPAVSYYTIHNPNPPAWSPPWDRFDSVSQNHFTNWPMHSTKTQRSPLPSYRTNQRLSPRKGKN